MTVVITVRSMGNMKTSQHDQKAVLTRGDALKVAAVEVPESKPFRAYEMVTQVPAIIDDFIAKTEAQYNQAGLGQSATSLAVKAADTR